MAEATGRQIPFEIEIPATFFEKADAPEGKRRRIAGVLSTEDLDQQQEVVVQKGLNLKPFLKNGWLNDNHKKNMSDVLGYPERADQFKKGDQLPDGSIAKSNTTWVEGYLLKTRKADEVWELGNALKETGRHLGFSVEGSVDQRIGRDRKVIAKATVKHAAITHAPVNDNTRLDTLAKSLEVAQATDPDELSKMVAMGTHPTPGAPPVGPQTGETAGQVIAPESLEGATRKDQKDEDDPAGEDVVKAFGFMPQDALRVLRARIPNATPATLLMTLKAMRAQGLL